MDNVFDATNHPRSISGRFSDKEQSRPQVTLSEKAVTGHVNDYLMGSAEDLNAAQRLAIVRLFGEMPVRPNISVNDEDDIDLIYNLPDSAFVDASTVRLTLDRDGRVVRAGSGEHWDDDNSTQEDFVRLVEQGF
ncbi:hypothetical protein F1C58_16555 (plasmid) [Glaciihabitans sp. INWT7]|uniref:hypothetical protein n=1 Tax=Glaciihabitans sp. INWT7 TaxID=2596912 RepID=UPI001628D49D|nr:hypothetical protein [Glaciihabitans sp. INWT7]QNE48668.1 hypothetical protein F1C58_16555 [Glaciihabitans sp. INWT7]